MPDQTTRTHTATAGPPTAKPAQSFRRPCSEHDPELWFAERPEILSSAQAICAGCPIRAACLEGALRRQEPWGVWGGQIVLQGRVITGKRGRGRPRRQLQAA